MVHLSTNLTLRNMQQVSSCFREAGINMEVTNVYIHQKNRSMENSAIRSLHTRVVRNKEEGTYPLLNTTQIHLAKNVLPAMVY